MKKLLIIGCLLLIVLLVKAAGPMKPIAVVNLVWDAPTNNVNGVPITNKLSYNIYFGPSSGNYTNVITGITNLNYSVSNLTWGASYAFIATAVDTVTTLESDPSNEIVTNLPVRPNPPKLK